MIEVNHQELVSLKDRYLSAEEQGYPEAEQQILQALRYLAACCDGAGDKDHTGFNKIDAQFGADLANKQYPLTSRQLMAARRMLNKYQPRQLTPAGLLLPDETSVQTLARRKEEAWTRSQQSRENIAEMRQPTQSQARVIGLKDGLLGVMFPAGVSDFQENLRKIRAIKEEVEGIRVINSAMARVQFVEDTKDGKVFKYWQVPLEYAKRVIADFPDFKVVPEVLEMINVERRRIEEEQRIAEEKARIARERVEKLLACLGDLSQSIGGRVLYEHQREAVRTMLMWGSGIVAFDQGTGKTLMGALIGLAYKKAENCKVIIAGPKTMKASWIEEAERVECPIEYYSHDSIPEDIPGKYILIVDECDSYQNMRAARTKKFIDLAMKAVAVFPMSGTPARNGRPSGIYPALLAVKNPHVYAELSDGSLAPDQIKALKRRYEGRYCAAGATRFSQWDTTGASHLEEFHRKFVGTPRGILRKLIDDCIDLPEKVRELIPVDLNAEEIRTFEAEIAQMREDHEKRVAEKMEAFKAERLPILIEEEIRAWLRRKFDKQRIVDLGEMLKRVSAEEIEKFKSRTIRTLLGEEQERLRQADALVAMGQYRHAGSRAKSRSAIQMIRGIFAEDKEASLDASQEGREHAPAAVVVFCEFKDVAAQVAEAFDVPVLSGDTPDKKRKPMIDAFQNGERRVFVSIYGAGGVGITLTAAAHIILIGRPWTPGAAFQAEARIRRIGQTRTCLCQWLQIPAHINHVDGRIDQILQSKQKNISMMLDGAKEHYDPNALAFDAKEALDLFYEATHFKAGQEVEAEVVPNI